MSPVTRPSTGVSITVQYDKPLPPLQSGIERNWNDHGRVEIRPRRHDATETYDDKPLPPIMDTLNSPIQGPRKPNLSLFSLFSRPKVQKSRGYAESGLQTPLPRDNHHAPRSSHDDITQHSRHEIPRSTSSMSFRTHRTHGLSKKAKHSTARRESQDHRNIHYDPPPLFQAFARSVKSGLVEITTASPQTVISKSRTKRVGALQLPADGIPRASTDTSRSTDALRLSRLASRTSGSMSVTHVDLERKILVLVTSGHLLQYAEYGPNGRLPEKVLVLGEHSAAFASDLISGRPHVAQISQEVNGDGVPVPSGGSLFSKVAIKSATEKKLISNILFVLPDGDELNAWLSAVRNQIEELGGSSSIYAASTRVLSSTEQQFGQTPRHSEDPAPMQRYHIRRASSRSGTVLSRPDTSASPVETPTISEPTPHTRAKSRHSIEEAEAFADLLAAGATYTKPRTSTEEAEAFGDVLAAGASYSKPGSTRGRSMSDAHSINSSVAQSVDHLRLNSLRDSARMSTNTNVTGLTSRTNSLTSDHAPRKLSLDGPGEAYGTRGPYRNLSSYGKRRSAMPTMSSPQPTSNVGVDLTIKTKISSPIVDERGEDSPVMGWNHSTITALPPITPRGKVLKSRQSMPLLIAVDSRNDSKIMSPPPIVENGERPQSFVGDLPTSSHWTTKLSREKRSSKIQALPTGKQMHRMSSDPSLRTVGLSPGQRATNRNTSQPFTLPLKVNPSGTPSSPSWQNSRQMQSRQSQSSPDSSEPETPLPRIHTLTAHIAPTHKDGMSSTIRTTVSREDNIPHNPPRPASATSVKSKTPTITGSMTSAPAPKRLSIFPPAQPNPATLENRHIPARVRPPSLVIPQTRQANQPKRPISVQIRAASNPGSFHHHGNPKSASTVRSATRSFTPPIRSLRPSRSPSSATSSSPSSKSWSVLPALDLGIPVVGLGPPAPPPSAPLPMLPGSRAGSRATSPVPSRVLG